ncbi:unnamed protein product [Cuscuta campestris]|uniref:S-protein homolog n=1 Tax=Cuscuta campestris TaxID=132261 RepID=A0A484KHB3_9ASTE|nr:unnamed protein product [Cuscuta campestris]
MMMCSRSFFILPLTIIIISCAILAPHLQTASANPKKVVRILDSIPTNNPVQPMKPLLVHCKSKDTDLGVWAMNENEEREFHFRVQLCSGVTSTGASRPEASSYSTPKKASAGTAIAGPKKVVRITDLIPTHNPVQPPKVLNVHCKSKDDDLGLWTMTENQSREFHFRVNYWWTTLFWCRFDWGTKFANFVVFDANSRDGYDCRRERYCNWRVKTDGFYFAKGEFPKDSDFVRKGYWMDK